MHSRTQLRPLLGLATSLAVLPAMMAQNPGGTGNDGDPGIPMFLTSPVHSKVAAPGLKSGHHTFDEGGQTPAPFQVNLGAAPYQPASFGSAPPATQLPQNVTNSTEYEGETAAAATGGILVGASNHIFPGACSTNNCFPLALTTSDGTTWTKTVLPRVWNGINMGIGFDPSIDFDKNGTFYHTYGVAPLSGNYPNGIVGVKSTDGINWTPMTPVTWNAKQNFDDKYWVAVDRSTSQYANRIYIAWDRNTSTNQILYVSSSSNGGATWTAPVKVDDGRSKFERVIGAYPAVDHNTGTVYVSWHNYAQNKIFVDKSSNGGATWGTDVAAATTHTGFGQDIGCVGGRSQSPAHHLKVGPSGTLHLVYADAVTGRGYDILYTRSTNGGATWSAPVTLNNDGTANDQFHPALAVDSNGSGGDRVTVSFYDRRNDASDCLAQVYATQSVNSGTTWSANTVLYSTASQFDGNANGPGDYSSAAPSPFGPTAFFSIHPQPSSNPFDIYAASVAP